MELLFFDISLLIGEQKKWTLELQNVWTLSILMAIMDSLSPVSIVHPRLEHACFRRGVIHSCIVSLSLERVWLCLRHVPVFVSGTWAPPFVLRRQHPAACTMVWWPGLAPVPSQQFSGYLQHGTINYHHQGAARGRRHTLQTGQFTRCGSAWRLPLLSGGVCGRSHAVIKATLWLGRWVLCGSWFELGVADTWLVRLHDGRKCGDRYKRGDVGIREVFRSNHAARTGTTHEGPQVGLEFNVAWWRHMAGKIRIIHWFRQWFVAWLTYWPLEDMTVILN